MRQQHSFVCPISPQTVCLGLDDRGRSAHFEVNLIEPPSLPQWRRHDESPDQTKAGHPQGMPSGASSRERGPVYTWNSVHRVADCQPTQPDAVAEKLAVFTINPSQ